MVALREQFRTTRDIVKQKLRLIKNALGNQVDTTVQKFGETAGQLPAIVDTTYGPYSDKNIATESKQFLDENQALVDNTRTQASEIIGPLHLLEENQELLEGTHQSANEILYRVAGDILEENQAAIENYHGDNRDLLLDIFQGLRSDDTETRNRAIESLQGHNVRDLINSLEQSDLRSALVQARMCVRLTITDSDAQTRLSRDLQSSIEGQRLRERLQAAIVPMTRENMAHILFSNPEERTGRITYTHEEVIKHMPAVLENIYLASVAQLGFLPHDEQLYGVIATVNGPGERGTVINMKTGEGKTFVAAASAIIQALHNTGVHVATSNDHLAEEGAKVAALLSSALGMRVGFISSQQPERKGKPKKIDDAIIEPQRQKITQLDNFTLEDTDFRRDAYNVDITYAWGEELKFDRIRDLLVTQLQQLRQVRSNTEEQWEIVAHAYGIIDEIDAVLIDQAITPTNISGIETVEEESVVLHETEYTERELRILAARIVNELELNSHCIIEDNRVFLTPDVGIAKIEELLRVTDVIGIDQRHKPPILLDYESYYEVANTADSSAPRVFDTFAAFQDRPDNLPTAANFETYLNQALQARFTQTEGRNYHVAPTNKFVMTSQYTSDNTYYDIPKRVIEVQLLNQDTGRVLPLSRYQHGLHAALEAKIYWEQHQEAVDPVFSSWTVVIKPENTTLSSITTAHYWQTNYDGISGMSATTNDHMSLDAPTQLLIPPAQEFHDVYGLRVVEIPRHVRESKRIDHKDSVMWGTREAKLLAIASFIGTFYGYDDPNERLEEFKKTTQQRHQQAGRPVLVTFRDVEEITRLEEIIRQQPWYHEGISINKLSSAEETDEEAERIANAGQIRTITLATIAGRGTDIRLSEEARAAGGLFVVRGDYGNNQRIDDQGNGRAGRQDDPGESRGYCSLDDELMQARGSEWVAKQKARLIQEIRDDGTGELIGHTVGALPIEITKMLIMEEQALTTNRAIEARYAMYRDHEIINEQLASFYADRMEILMSENPNEQTRMLLQSFLHNVIIEDYEPGIFSHQTIPDSIQRSTITPEALQRFIDYTRDLDLPQKVYENLRYQALVNAHSVKKFSEEAMPLLMTDLQSIYENPRQIQSTLLTVFNQHVGTYLTDVLEMHDDIMARSAVGEQMTPETFNIEASERYRTFKPTLQRAMIQTLFRPA